MITTKTINILLSAFILSLSFYNLSYAADTSQSTFPILQRISPVGKSMVHGDEPATQKSSEITKNSEILPVKAAADSGGEKIYTQHCQVCHAAGLAGAPKLSDTSNWQARYKQGFDTLLKHVIQGYKAMPPKGGCASCSEADIKTAIEYMLKQAKVQT